MALYIYLSRDRERDMWNRGAEVLRDGEDRERLLEGRGQTEA